METSFTELKNKEVINVLSGRLLGNVCDVVLDLRCNRIIGFVVPGAKSFFSLFKSSQEIFIPYNAICKVGEDVILVEVVENVQKKKKQNRVKVFDAGDAKEQNSTELLELKKFKDSFENETPITPKTD